MKIKNEPIREDKYLNIKVDTYSVEFNLLDSLLSDLSSRKFCTVITDGQNKIIHGYSDSKSDALEKHKECYERLLLRPYQWFDVKNRKFKYLNYIETEEKFLEVTTINESSLYSSFVREAQKIIVIGANNSLTFYTKREATEYTRSVSFAIFSGLRVKVGKLKNTSYASLSPMDSTNVSTFVNQTDKELSTKFLKNMYTQGLEYDKWEMFIDLLEAKISEYYKEGNRNIQEIPNFIILEEILKEVEERIALTRKPDEKGAGSAGGEADWSKRYPNNKPGKYYVDEKCIVCDACAVAAPKFFKLNAQHAFVTAQPTTPEEIEQCNAALSGCPVSAIGSNGDIMAAAAAAPPKVEAKVEVKKPVEKVEVKKEEASLDVAQEMANLKDMISLVSPDKMAEIKAMLKSFIPEKQEEVSTVVEEVKTEEVVTEVSGGAKALPATSPDGSAVYPENVAGLFYVDDKCISCDACPAAAPDFFVINDGHAYVFAQPKNDKEIEQCKEAMAGCPVSSINMNI